MSYTVGWTDESKSTFNENMDYLSKKWDLLTINKFLDRVDEVIKQISLTPELYPVYRKRDNVHKCVVNKHITLYYRISNSQRVDLITFWNTHQDPEKIKI